MTSLVTEVLASAGRLAKDDWNTKMSKLNHRAFDIKRKLNESIEQRYSEFISTLATSDDLATKLSELSRDVENLNISLESVVKTEIQESTKEFEQLSTQLAKTTALACVLEKLYDVQMNLESYEKEISGKNFNDTAVSLEKIKATLDSVAESSFVETEFYKMLRVELTVRQESLKHALDEAWKSSVVWKKPNENQTNVCGMKLIINFGNESSFSTMDIVHGLHRCEMLENKIRKFASTFMETILTPLIKDQSLQHFIEVTTSGCCLYLTKEESDVSATKGQDKQVFSPSATFTKVWQVLGWLNDNLLHLKIQESKEKSLMTIFRTRTCEDVLKLLVDECLHKSVPDSKAELQSYDKVVQLVQNFENSLKSIHFLPDNIEAGNLLSYVADIHVHFANRRCTSVISRARQILKKDIHETVEIKDGEKASKLSDVIMDKINEELEKSKSDCDKIMLVGPGLGPVKETVDENVFLIPRCRISKSTLEFVDLAYETLFEAISMSPECAVQMVETAEQLFEMYHSIVEVIHRETLESLPQVSALHHNNCHYIAHHLLTLGHQFSSRLSGSVKGLNLTFVHQVPILRQAGLDCFLSQMRKQRDQLTEYLKPLKGFADDSGPGRYQAIERPVKQVLHQLNHLRNVWLDVLPPNMFTRSMCTLVDTLITEVVRSICNMEDISSDDSIQLQTICCILRDQIPSLFEKDDAFPWQRLSQYWMKLVEMIFVLDSSLMNIVDRWADGKGPLAVAFTVVETKGLIRALFQNTERRANAISKIRY